MTEPHRIRLRAGWTLGTQEIDAPWALPCSGRELAQRGQSVRLTRQFGHPPVRSETQVCRLVVRHVAGVVAVEVDGQKFEPAFPVDDHPEAGFDFELPAAPGHRVVLCVDTPIAADVAEWGQIWLEISES